MEYCIVDLETGICSLGYEIFPLEYISISKMENGSWNVRYKLKGYKDEIKRYSFKFSYEEVDIDIYNTLRRDIQQGKYKRYKIYKEI